MPTRSDKPSTRKSAPRTKTRETKPKENQPFDSSTERAANAEETAPETLVPEVVRTKLTREAVSSDADRGRWITERAYEIAQARGFAPGAELDDWLQAEREYDSKLRAQTRPDDQFTG